MSPIAEIEAKKTTLESALATALEAAKVLTPATPEFDEAYGRYLTAKAALVKIPDELAAAMRLENKAAIDADATVACDAIFQLVEGLKVADKLGVPVVALRYYRIERTDGEGKVSVEQGVVFNPVASKAAPKGERKTKGAGHTQIVTPEGERLSLTKFVLANATEEDKASDKFKYPHSFVDSKPKFDTFCTSHSLVGFTYETPAGAAAVESGETLPAS